jgi:hypothetical protein
VGTVNEWYGYVPGFSRTFAARTGADLVIDSQGRIVVVGAGPRASGGDGSIDVWVARLVPGGGTDPSFGNAGVATFGLASGSADYGLRLAVDASNRPIVAGVTHPSALTGGSDQRQEFTARLTTSGALDGSPVLTSGGAGHRVNPTSLSVGGSRAVIGGAWLDGPRGYVSAHLFSGTTGTTTTSTPSSTSTTSTTTPSSTSTTSTTSTTTTAPPTTPPTAPPIGGGSGGSPAGQLFTAMTPWRAHDSRTAEAVVAAGDRRAVRVAGVAGGAPAGAVAVAVNLTVVDPTHGGYVTIFPGGSAVPTASTVNVAAGQTMANAVVVGVGAGGTVDIVVGAGRAHVVVDVMGYFTASHGFDPIQPTRALDTRAGLALGPGESRVVTVASAALGATAGGQAVALNLTAVDPTAGGHLRAWPGQGPEPHASVLNFAAGQTVANGFVSGVDGSGRITVRNHSHGTVHLVIDVNGVFRATAAFHAVNPVRAEDTRNGAPMAAGTSRTVSVTGLGGVPTGGVRGVVVNVTVVEPSAAGYVSAYPAGLPTPLVSLLNFTPGVTVANGVVLGVDAAGRIEVHNSVGATHVVVDVLGWF